MALLVQERRREYYACLGFEVFLLVTVTIVNVLLIYLQRNFWCWS